jgi:hypothetical protein
VDLRQPEQYVQLQVRVTFEHTSVLDYALSCIWDRLNPIDFLFYFFAVSSVLVIVIMKAKF